MGSCSVCGKPVNTNTGGARGLCSTHYQAQRRAAGKDKVVNAKKERAEQKREKLRLKTIERLTSKRVGNYTGSNRAKTYQLFTSLGNKSGDWEEISARLPGRNSYPCRTCGFPPTYGACKMCLSQRDIVEPDTTISNSDKAVWTGRYVEPTWYSGRIYTSGNSVRRFKKNRGRTKAL